MSNIIIGKGICINNKSINTKIKIDNEQFKIYGYLGNAKVIWYYKNNIYPFIKGYNDVFYRRIAKDYIIATLLQNNIAVNEFVLSCKQYAKDGNIKIEIDKNNFVIASYNGWIKGFVNNNEFVWNTTKYKQAIYVSGCNYKYCDLTDTIIQWIKDAGYEDVNDLIYKLKTTKIKQEEQYIMPDEIVEETMIEENNKYLNKNILNIDEVHLDNFIN